MGDFGWKVELENRIKALEKALACVIITQYFPSVRGSRLSNVPSEVHEISNVLKDPCSEIRFQLERIGTNDDVRVKMVSYTNQRSP